MFRRNMSSHLQGRNTNQARNQYEADRFQSLLFERHSVRISTETMMILTKNFHGFPESLKAISEEVPHSGHDRFLSNPFQFISIILVYDAIIICNTETCQKDLFIQQRFIYDL
jgi:hypothetical protein